MTNARFLKRYFAYFLDYLLFFNILIFLSLAFLQIVSVISFVYPVDLIVNAATFFITVWSLGFILFLFYEAYFMSKFGGTVGKLLYGIKVVDGETGNNISLKTALWRVTAGYTFSFQFLGLGYLKIIKHPEKLTWHDEMFNTRVVNAGKHRMGIVATIVFCISLVAGIFLTVNTGAKLFVKYQPNQPSVTLLNAE
jgi:uncharacterized RDD family membrane protein YckC